MILSVFVAGLWTTPTDLAKFAIEHQLSVEGKSNKILKREFEEKMMMPYIGGRYGLGWGMQKTGDAVYFQHDGGNEGFSCSLIAHMKAGYGAVVMTYASSAGIIPEIMRSIAREYQWEDYLPAPHETVVLAEEKLQRMTGRFLLGSDRAVTVRAAGGRILADVTRMSRTELVPISAALEGAMHGFAFGSGLAALDVLLKVLKSGDHVVCGENMYGGSHRLMERIYTRFGLKFSFVDSRDIRNIEAALRPETRMIYCETPTNPMMQLTDLSAVGALTQAHGYLFAVDNTFATPIFQRPLEVGADVVLHSTTKYLNGHSDMVGGMVVVSDSDLADRLGFLQNAAGAVSRFTQVFRDGTREKPAGVLRWVI